MFELEPLPYAETALEPHISAKTLSFHYGKHHKGYLTNLNNLVFGEGAKFPKYQGKDLLTIVRESAINKDTPVFNNAAQVWNHSFYWECMKANGGGEPTNELKELIVSTFGSYEKFKEQFVAEGMAQFGSGWVWLVLNGEKLEIMKTGNADNPVCHGAIPIMTADVWEHAYYLDYQNRRLDYITVFLDHLVNWDFVLNTYESRRGLSF